MVKTSFKGCKNLVSIGSLALSKQQIKQNTSSLLYTEATHIIEEANAKFSEEWGITHYIYLATLDNKISPMLQRLDGKNMLSKTVWQEVTFHQCTPIAGQPL